MKTRKRRKKETITLNTSYPNGIGPDEMTDIIAKAIIKADEMRVQKEEEKKKEIKKKWCETIGYKDYSNKKGLAKQFYRFINDAAILLKMPFISKEKIETDRVAWSLLQVALIILFQIITYGFFPPVFFFLLYKAIWQRHIIYSPLRLLTAFFVYILYGLFRMVTVEIDRIKERDYLIELFTAIITIISVVVAVIAIVGGK